MVSRPRPYAPERQIDRLLTRVDRVENGAPLASTSVTNGRTRFVGPESWQLEGSGTVDGTLTVEGLLRILGTLRAAGVIEFTGPVTIAGATSIEGDTTISGDTEITGNMTVDGGGRIRVAGGDSPATLRDGRLEFETGGRVEADVSNGGARLREGDAVVNVGNVASIRKGDSSVIAGPLGVTINGAEVLLQGALRASGLTTAPSGVATVPLVYAPSTGRVYRGS